MPTHGEAPSGNWFWRILLTLLALETGVFLILVPWSSVWDHNFLLGYLSPLHALLRTPYVRGAVSALGVVNIGVGFAELMSLVKRGGNTKPAARER